MFLEASRLAGEEKMRRVYLWWANKSLPHCMAQATVSCVAIYREKMARTASVQS